jgi:hypothetical protein
VKNWLRYQKSSGGIYSTYVDFSSFILMSVQEALNKIIDYKHKHHMTYICTIITCIVY